MADLPNNDPRRQTCRVAKREGERGARIHPPGCQVRAEVAPVGVQAGRAIYAPRTQRYDPTGDYREYTKRGKIKRPIKSRRHIYLKLLPTGVHAFNQGNNNMNNIQIFMWNSGATEVTMQGITANYLFGQHRCHQVPVYTSMISSTRFY